MSHVIMESINRIDTHSHFLPDFYREALMESGITKPDGMPAIPTWNEKAHLELMTKTKFSKSYLNISSPGVNFGRIEKAKNLARRVNEYAFNLAQRNPGKFGSFASLPLPDIDGSLEEISYALDELEADGFTLLTNYSGIYLGDKSFDSLFQELNRRKTKVFVHPTSNCKCVHDTSQPLQTLNFPSPMMEFFFDAARAVANLIFSGTVSACPDIKFLIPHCGGVLPPLVDRFGLFTTMLEAKVSTQDIQDILRDRFFYDLAGCAMGNQIHGLLRWTGTSQLLYGSDFPFTPADVIKRQVDEMDKVAEDLWSVDEIERVYSGNAEELMA